MTVDVDIVTHDEPHVLAVPIDAVRKDGTAAYVLVVKNGHAVRVDVTLGTQNDTQAVVKAGLHERDVVVADKNPGLTPDVAVKPAPSASPGAQSSPDAS